MRTAVVVVNYGSHDLVATNTRGLACADVVLVDNLRSASDRRAARDLARGRGWLLVEAEGNPGFGGGVNLGVRAAARAGFEAIVLLNPDARMDQAALAALSEVLRREPWALVSPTIVDSDGRIYFGGYAVVMSRGVMTRVIDVDAPQPGTRGWISGACMAFTTELFEAVGGYDESYFLYWEDVDFSVRAADAGARLVVLPDVTVVHDEGGTQEGRRGRAKSLLYYRYNTRNRLLFAARHLPTKALLSWVARTPRTSYLVLLQGGRRQLLHSRKPLWAVARGSLEGVCLALQELARRTGRGRPRR